MSDDLTPPGRDPDLARLLAVAPLDDLTRRSLVRGALAEAPRGVRPVGRLTALVGVAAALVLGLVVGTVLVTRPDDPAPPTAAPAPAQASTAPASTPAPADSSADAAVPGVEPAPPTMLGDLGTVADPAALRAAIAARLESGRAATITPAAGTCVDRGPTFAGLLGISAVGTATRADGSAAVVFVGTAPDGVAVAVVLSAESCAVLERVPLQT